jgi:AraC-like DNA-binding protein
MPNRIGRDEVFESADIAIVVERFRSSLPVVKMHSHDFSELVLIHGGRGTHATESEQWPIGAGDVFVVNGTRPHEYRDMDRLDMTQVLFSADELSMPLHDLGSVPGYHALFTLEPSYRSRHGFGSRLRLGADELVRAESLLASLSDQLDRKGPAFRFMAVAFFMELVGFLSLCYGRSRASSSREILRIAEAISRIEGRFREGVTVNELARIAHMSERNFLREFRNAMNMSPIDYLIRRRISRACELLRRTGLTIGEVGYRVGFNDSNYFSRQFRKVTGQTPSAFRKTVSS